MARAEKGLIVSVVDLWQVAETNDVRALKRILSTGIDVDARNQHGTTALMRAVSHGRLQMVEALIAKGADPNAVRHDNFTPLTLAAFFGYTDIVRLLVQAGAEKDRVTRNGTSARMWASARTFQGVAKYLDEVQPIEPAKDLILVNQQPVLPEQPTLAAESELTETDKTCEGLAESAPLIINPRLENVVPRPLFSRWSPLKMTFALLMIVVLVVVVMLARAPRRAGLQKIETTAAVSTVDEPKVESVASRSNAAAELPKKTPNEVVAVDDTKPQRTDGRVVRTPKSTFADEGESVRKQMVLKPSPKNEIAGAPVSNPAPVPKREVAPLSTQLVSSPSKTASKPKVIQWP